MIKVAVRLLFLAPLLMLGCSKSPRAEVAGQVIASGLDESGLMSMPVIAASDSGIYALWNEGNRLQLAVSESLRPQSSEQWAVSTVLEDPALLPFFDMCIVEGRPAICYAAFASDFDENHMPRILDSRLDLLLASGERPTAPGDWQHLPIAKGEGPYLYCRIAAQPGSLDIAYIHKVSSSGGHGYTEEGELWDVREQTLNFARLSLPFNSGAPALIQHRPLFDPAELDFFSGEAAASGSGLSLSYLGTRPLLAWVAQHLAIPMVGFAADANPAAHTDWTSYELDPGVRSFRYVDCEDFQGKPGLLFVDAKGSYSRFGEKTDLPSRLVFASAREAAPASSADWDSVRFESFAYGMGYRCINWAGRPVLVFSAASAQPGIAIENLPFRPRTMHSRTAQPLAVNDFDERLFGDEGSVCRGLDATVLPDGGLAILWVESGSRSLLLEIFDPAI